MAPSSSGPTKRTGTTKAGTNSKPSARRTPRVVKAGGGGTSTIKKVRTKGETEKRSKLSGEGLALGLTLVSAFVLASLFTPLFGPLGRLVSSVARLFLGEGSSVVATAILLFSIAHISGVMLTRPRRSWVALAGLSIGVVASISAWRFSGGLNFTETKLKGSGGVVGEVIGGSIASIASRYGALVITVFLTLLATSYVFGIGFDGTAHLISDRLRSIRDARLKRRSEPLEMPTVFDLQGDSQVIPEAVMDIGTPLEEERTVYVDLTMEPGESTTGAVEDDPEESISLDDIGHDGVVPKVASKTKEKAWRLPALSLLTKGGTRKIDEVELADRGRALQASLMTHGVPTRLSGMTVGPTVTRYELELGEGVKVAKLLSLQRDIAYAMAAADIRILAPIPGRSAIGVEVPNRSRETVTLGDVLASPEMRNAENPLEVPLGRDIYGRTIVVNLADMPHVLIAGATGSGKSSALNSMITSVLMRATPAQVRMILVDPKRVELGQYSRLPHLLSAVVVDPKKAAGALAWATKEMDRRYDLLAEVGVRNITGYNELVKAAEVESQDFLFDGSDESPKQLESLPYILVVVDELNDLMMVAPRDVEDSICRIAQKARAVGIHLLIATQRPSVDVITGVIKANVPSRMAFSVASQADSRVILDQPGAEKLIGKGDMLIVTADSSVPRRIQTPWVSEGEVRAVVGHWLRIAGPSYLEELEEEVATDRSSSDDPSGQDELYGQALSLVVSSQLGSTSMLQRKLRVGFARAGRLMDLLEQAGVVGPSEGSRPREVFMSKEELEDLNI